MVITGPVRRGLRKIEGPCAAGPRESPRTLTRRDEERHDHERTAREDQGSPQGRPLLPAPDALAARVTCGGDEGRSTEQPGQMARLFLFGSAFPLDLRFP